MNNEINYQQPQVVKKNNIIRILLIVSIIICMGACFLPFFKIGSYSINYIYNKELASYGEAGGVADGIFIIVFGIISILTLLIGKKRLPAVIFQALGAAVFFYDFISGQQSEASRLISRSYSVGFYIIFIFIIISLVLSIVRLVAKNKFE